MAKFRRVADYSRITQEDLLRITAICEEVQSTDEFSHHELFSDLFAIVRKIVIQRVKVPEKVYFFGCAKPYASDGHQFYLRPWYSDYESRKWIPWSLGELDTRLASVLNPHVKDEYRRQECPQGVVSVTYKENWTALSFWDRTGDQRGKSNSTFLIDSIVDFKEGIELARASWPQLFKRFKEAGLELREYGKESL
jgi:hypothetical protein